MVSACVRAVANPGDALTVLSAEPVDVVLIDPRLPDLDVGLAFLVEVHRTVAVRRPRGDARVATDVAPTSMRNGAVAFVAKSGQPDVILATLARAAGARVGARPRLMPESPVIARNPVAHAAPRPVSCSRSARNRGRAVLQREGFR